MPRFIKVPKLPFPFVEWFGWYLDNEPRLMKPHSRIRAVQRMLEAVDKIQDEILELRDEDCKLVVDLLTDEENPPACGFMPELSVKIKNAAGEEETKSVSPRPRDSLVYIDPLLTAAATRPEVVTEVVTEATSESTEPQAEAAQ